MKLEKKKKQETKMGYYLGIDTSNYTTSLAVVDENNNIVCDLRRILKVPPGERGLRQSEAFFQHCNNFPELFAHMSQTIEMDKILAVAVSTQPRYLEKSYMPVFTAGYNYAKVLSKALNIPLTQCSHQEGHIYSAMIPLDLDPPFLALHLSGGTTDLLLVEKARAHRLKVEIIASSSDIHCGQFVDRIGVYMGLAFPAGKIMDEMSLKGEKELIIPSSVKEGIPSFSGPLTAAQKLVDAGEKPENVALATFKCISKTIEKMLFVGMEKTGLKTIVLVGGVASNTLVRTILLKKIVGNLYFAPVNLSPDNGVGIAFMGKKELEQKF